MPMRAAAKMDTHVIELATAESIMFGPLFL